MIRENNQTIVNIYLDGHQIANVYAGQIQVYPGQQVLEHFWINYFDSNNNDAYAYCLQTSKTVSLTGAITSLRYDVISTQSEEPAEPYFRLDNWLKLVIADSSVDWTSIEYTKDMTQLQVYSIIPQINQLIGQRKDFDYKYGLLINNMEYDLFGTRTISEYDKLEFFFYPVYPLRDGNNTYPSGGSWFKALSVVDSDWNISAENDFRVFGIYTGYNYIDFYCGSTKRYSQLITDQYMLYLEIISGGLNTQNYWDGTELQTANLGDNGSGSFSDSGHNNEPLVFGQDPFYFFGFNGWKNGNLIDCIRVRESDVENGVYNKLYNVKTDEVITLAHTPSGALIGETYYQPYMTSDTIYSDYCTWNFPGNVLNNFSLSNTTNQQNIGITNYTYKNVLVTDPVENKSYETGAKFVTEYITKDYFTIRNTGSTAADVLLVETGTTNITPDIEYSYDGTTWTALTVNNPLHLNSNRSAYIRGSNNQLGIGSSAYWKLDLDSFESVKLSGDLRTLYWGDNYSSQTTFSQSYAAERLFYTTTETGKNYAEIDASELKLVAIGQYCYYYMFSGQEKLISAPLLPATTLADNCYLRMFNGCTSLTEAPELPATALATKCYNQMFYNCSNLEYIKALFLDTPLSSSTTSSTLNWVYGVAASGVFIKNPNATWTDTGTYAVPVDWRVETQDLSSKPIVGWNTESLYPGYFYAWDPEGGTVRFYVDGILYDNGTNDYVITQPMYNTDFVVSADTTQPNKPTSLLVKKTYTVLGYKTPDPVINVNYASTEVSATGEGTVLLYVDGTLVTNPYVLSEGTYTVTATAQDTGKQISNTVTENVTISASGMPIDVTLALADLVSEFSWTSTSSIVGTWTTSSGIVLTFTAGTSSTTPKYYSTTGGAIRMYTNNTLEISTSGGHVIKAVEFGINGASYVFQSGDNAQGGSLTTSGTTCTWDFDGLNLTSVLFTDSTSAQRRPNSIKVTYIS